MNEVLDGLDTLPYENDGLMIIPDFAPYDPWQGRDKPPIYKRSLTKFADICKWKHSRELTIDLRIATGPNGVIALYTSGKGKQDSEWFGTLYYPLKWENGADPKDPLLNQNGFVPNGTIVEFAYDPNGQYSLKATRIRYDKQNPNVDDVVNDTWDLAHRPVEEKTLRGGGTLLMRRYHNRIKRELFRSMKPGSSILDIGSGNGGDIDKWPDLSYVVAVEPDADHRKEFIRRFKQSSTHKKGITKVKLLGNGGEDVEDITAAVQAFVPEGKVDYVVMMLSLTFFWKDFDMLQCLTDVILNNIKPDGEVIFLTMDGDSVEQSFNPTMGGAILDRLELGEVTIQMLERHPEKGHGQKIRIVIPDSIVGEQIEYLAKLDDLATLLGGTLTKESATKETFLNPGEKVLTSLYSYGRITNIDTERITVVNKNKTKNKMSRLGSDEIIEPSSDTDETDPLSDEPNVEFVQGACIRDGPCDSGECGAGLPEPEIIPVDPGHRLGMMGRHKVERISATWADASLVRYNTIGDGNCLYHAFLNAVSERYSLLNRTAEKTLAAKSLRWDIGDKIKEPMLEDSIYSYWALINNGRLPIQYFMELAQYQRACDERIRDPVTPLRTGVIDPRVIDTFDFDFSEEGTAAAIQAGGHYSGQELIIFLTEFVGVDINLYQPWENETIFQFTTMREGNERNVVMIASVPGHYETIAVATTFNTDEGKEFHGLQTVFDHDDPLFDNVERLPPIDNETLVEDLENTFVAEVSPTLKDLRDTNSSFSVFKRLWPGMSPSFKELLTLAFEINHIQIPTEEDWEHEPTCFKSQVMMAKDLDIELPTPPLAQRPTQRARPGVSRATIISRREEAQLQQALQQSLEQEESPPEAASSSQTPEAASSTQTREDDELQAAIQRSLEREDAASLVRSAPTLGRRPNVHRFPRK